MQNICARRGHVTLMPERVLLRRLYFFSSTHCTKQKFLSNVMQLINFVVDHVFAASPFLGQ